MAKLIWQNKIKIFVSALLVVAAIGAIFTFRDRSQAQEDREEKKVVTVKTELVSDLKSASGVLNYPATVAGEQEVKVVAQIAGVASSVNFDLGDPVAAGKLLVRVDDQGTAIGAGESGFKSGQIQQLEKALEIAKESLSLAKNNFKKDKSKANKTAKDIAELEVESAQIALDNAVNAHLITSPISGVITNREISAGDTVSAGQLLATISKTNKVKIQFFVDKEEVGNISLNSEIVVRDGEKGIPAKIANISPQADAVTKRFLVEASPSTSEALISGTVVGVSIPTQNIAGESGALILPLSAITVAQNENYIFTVEGDKARKIAVEVKKISGETAEVKADLSDSDQIIIEGNKLVQDGGTVKVN